MEIYPNLRLIMPIGVDRLQSNLVIVSIAHPSSFCSLTIAAGSTSFSLTESASPVRVDNSSTPPIIAIIAFSAKLTIPNGVLESPPTQAHMIKSRVNCRVKGLPSKYFSSYSKSIYSAKQQTQLVAVKV